MSLDIFTRDREAKTDINIEMRKDDSSNSSNSSNNNNNVDSENKNQDLSAKYRTLIIKDLETV